MFFELLRMEDISVTKNGYRILNSARINVRKGETVGLLGLNDAGKTMLMRVLMGKVIPDRARIYFDEVYIKNISQLRAAVSDVHYIFDPNALFERFSIMENIYVMSGHKKEVIIRRKQLIQKTEALMKQMGLALAPISLVGELSNIQKLIIQIAKAVAHGARLVVLDNIYHFMSQPMIDALLSVLKHLNEQGISFIMLDYRPSSLMSACDRIFVLRRGRTEGVFESKIFDEKTLAAIMTGYRTDSENLSEPRKHGAKIQLMFDNVYSGTLLKGFSFHLVNNEILGFCTMSENFASNFSSVLSGKIMLDQGRILINGKEAKFVREDSCIRQGVHIVTKKNEVFKNLPLYDNIMIAVEKKYSNSAGIISTTLARSRYSEIYSEYLYGNIVRNKNLPCRNDDKLTKKIISSCRGLAADCNILIFDDPTQDMDMFSMQKMFNFISQITNEEHSSVIISSNIHDLIQICDRIYFIFAGQCINVFNVHSSSYDEVLKYYQYFCYMR